jgi:hypothetical protein
MALIKGIRRWIAWKMLRYIDWLEWRPNHSMRWYIFVFDLAYRVYPSEEEDFHKHKPSAGGIGLNAMELGQFWSSIEYNEDQEALQDD